MRRLAHLAAAVVAAVVLVGCESLGSLAGLAFGGGSSPSSADKIGALSQAISDTRKATEEFTPEQKYYVGRAVAATILGEPRYQPFDNPRAREYLNLLAVSLAWSSPLPQTFGGWHVQVLDSEEINAFGAPEGFILVTRGLLRCATSEDEVAAIVAHEIGHVVLEHGIKAIDTARKAGAVASIAKAGLLIAGSPEVQSLTSTFGDVVGDVMQTLVNKGYSRDIEYAADAFALELLQAAGYDPKALVRMLEVMQTKWKADGPGFMKTHPSPADRIRAAQGALFQIPAPIRVPAAAATARTNRYTSALRGI